MNKKHKMILLPLLICLAVSLSASGKKDENAAAVQEEPKAVRVSGRVRLVGNEPFPELVITGDDREWYIDRDDVPKLRDLQQRTVIVEGMETSRELTFANGMPAGTRFTLKDIRIITIQ